MQRVPHRSRLDCDREHPRLLTDGSEICIIDCPQGFHLFSHLGMTVKYFCYSHILTITRLLLSLCTWDITAHQLSDSKIKVWIGNETLAKGLVINRSDLTNAPCDNRLQHGASANVFSARCSLASARCVLYRFIRLYIFACYMMQLYPMQISMGAHVYKKSQLISYTERNSTKYT